MDSTEEEGSIEKTLQEEINELKRKIDDERMEKEVLRAKNKKLQRRMRHAEDSALLSSKLEGSWHSKLKDAQKEARKAESKLMQADSDLMMEKIKRQHLQNENARIKSVNQDLREEVGDQYRLILQHERNCRILSLRNEQATETIAVLHQAIRDYMRQVQYTIQCPVTLDGIYELEEGLRVFDCGHFIAEKAFQNSPLSVKMCPVCKKTITAANRVRFTDEILQNFRLLETISMDLPAVNPVSLLEGQHSNAQGGSARPFADSSSDSNLHSNDDE